MPAHAPADGPGPSPAPAAPVDGTAVDLLPCGRPVDALVDQADSGRLEPADAHQADCPYCRSALRDAALSGQALALLRAHDGPVPAGLVDHVMREVRRARTTGALIELGPAGRSAGGRRPEALQVAGGVRVHPQVIADLARIAATAVRGVTVARASATGRATSSGPADPAGRSGRDGPIGRIDIALGLLVDGRTPLPDLARAVRRAVRGAVRRATGTGRVEVELTALDLLPDT